VSTMPNSDKEDYDRALQLVQHHAQVVWWAFGTYLVTHTLILGFLTKAISEYDPSKSNNIRICILGASIFGFLLALLWWITFSYTHTQYVLRIKQAIRHEPNLGMLLSEGDKLAKEGSVCVNDHPVSMGYIVHKIPPRYAFRILMLLFAVAYIFIAYIFGPWH
jgi:hypothetical protein